MYDLVNCVGKGKWKNGWGFYNCANLVICVGTGIGVGMESKGSGFWSCTNLVNCKGYGNGVSSGLGFFACYDLTNCIGSGIGESGGTGYSFYLCTTASNCRYMFSTTNMWGGINKNIDTETCRKTQVEANNGTLNT